MSTTTSRRTTVTTEERAERKRAAKEQAARIAAAIAEAGAIVATGKCPTCGRALRRNWSLAGWWQCSQFGAPTFRADPAAPPCGWQAFTE